MPARLSPYSFPGISYLETPEHFINRVSVVVNVTPDDLRSKSRRRELSEARQLIIHMIAMKFPNLSLSTIGRMFGGRDHATIIHAKKSINDRLTVDKLFKAYYHKVTQSL